MGFDEPVQYSHVNLDPSPAGISGLFRATLLFAHLNEALKSLALPCMN